MIAAGYRCLGVSFKGLNALACQYEQGSCGAAGVDHVIHAYAANPSLVVLCLFIKAALLAKVSIVKVWKEEREAESRESYYDLTDDQFTLLAQAVAESDGAMKIVAHTAHEAAVPLVASR